MKKFAAFLSILIPCFCLTSPLLADTLSPFTAINFAFEGSAGTPGNIGDPFGGSGELRGKASSTPGMYYLLGSVLGNFDGAGQIAGYRADALDNPFNFMGNDNLIFLSGSTFSLDDKGIVFEVQPYTLARVWLDPIAGQYQEALYQFTSETSGRVLVSQQTAPVIFTSNGVQPVSVTPEPSSLVLLGTGVMGLAGVVRRRLAL